MHFLKFPSLTAIAFVLPFCASATGLYQCETTLKSEWISKEALTEKLEGQGWVVRFVKEDGGCWEVYGNTPEGKRVEGYFHPVTGEPKIIAQRGRVIFKANEQN